MLEKDVSMQIPQKGNLWLRSQCLTEGHIPPERNSDKEGIQSG